MDTSADTFCFFGVPLRWTSVKMLGTTIFGLVSHFSFCVSPNRVFPSKLQRLINRQKTYLQLCSIKHLSKNAKADCSFFSVRICCLSLIVKLISFWICWLDKTRHLRKCDFSHFWHLIDKKMVYRLIDIENHPQYPWLLSWTAMFDKWKYWSVEARLVALDEKLVVDQNQYVSSVWDNEYQ